MEPASTSRLGLRVPWVPLAFGLGTGASIQLNWLARFATTATNVRVAEARVAGTAVGIAALFALLYAGVRWTLGRLSLPLGFCTRFLRFHAWTYGVFLLVGLGGLGVRMSSRGMVTALVLLFLAANFVAWVLALEPSRRNHLYGSFEWLTFLFLLSGMAALVYQVTWQRALFTSFGVNIESVTLIVVIFMFGLGLGSLGGGFFSSRFPNRLPELFFVCECVVGVFGLVSLPLIHGVGQALVTQPLYVTGIAIFLLLCVPTFLMGATLPLLVAHLHTRLRHVGGAVGILYFVNTLGSALACFVTADFLFVFGGQQAAVLFAAVLNLSVAFLVLHHTRAAAQETTG